YFIMIDPLAAANIVTSGDNPSGPIIGPTNDAPVITPTVVEPVIIFARTPIINGNKITGIPVSTTAVVIVSTAGVPFNISLKEPPKPVTTKIIADTLSPSSTHVLVESFL